MSQAARIHWVDLSAKTIINTAEMALIRFPALKSVTILEHLPRYFLKAFSDFKFLFLYIRCDNKDLVALRLLANNRIRREAEVSLLRSQIAVVSSHMEPHSPAEEAQLFGQRWQPGHDGIHLSGPAGAFQDSLQRVISSM